MTVFGFSDWPFAIVPTPERGVALWADRAITRTQLDAIVDDWQHSKQSTITLMWADLGSGKTHTLYYLRALCQQLGDYCSYILLPQAITNFLDLYRAIAREFKWDAISPQKLQSQSWSVKSLKKALIWLDADGDVNRQNLARRWLTAERLTNRECEMLGIAQRIATQDEAVEILAAAINSLVSSNSRIVLMIDEYQRVAEGSRKQLQQIGHGIHALYNACPSNLSLVLSCATGMSDDYTMVLTPEVVSRLSPKRIELPYLNAADIVSYVRDLFVHYREKNDDATNEFYPLTEPAVRQFAEFLVNGLNEEATPRRINQAFDELLSYMRRVSLTALEPGGVTSWISQNGAALLRQIG